MTLRTPQPAPETAVARAPVIQRACTCGEAAGASGKCAACATNERLGIQPKLRISRPGDHYEREADRVADQVMARRSAPLTGPLPVTPLVQRQEEEEEELQPKTAGAGTAALQRQAGEDEEEEELLQPKTVVSGSATLQRQPEEEEEELLQPRTVVSGSATLQRQPDEEEEELLQPKTVVSGSATLQRQPEEEEEEEELVQSKAGVQAPAKSGAAAGQAARTVASGGFPLPRATRAFFEPRFGRDLGHVRLHTSTTAQAAARGINARAYTLRNHIAFAPGQYDPDTSAGRHLLAHELAHTLQQGPAAAIQRENGPAAPAAPGAPGGAAAAAPTAPTRIDFNFNNAIAIPAAAGGTLALTANTNGTQITWSIRNGTATKAAGTSISNAGAITLDPTQIGGSLIVRAENTAGNFDRPFPVASIPTGISATAVSSALNNAAAAYGAAFQHTFTSANGSNTVLNKLALGERFPTAPTPNAANHVFRGANWPFGRGADSFTLTTGTLPNNGAGGFVLDAAGQFVAVAAGAALATGDNVSTNKALIKLGDHVQSHSNPRPRNRLPVTLSLNQQFHFFNQRAAAGARWTRFTTTAHSRTLRRRTAVVEFVTTVNGVEHVQNYEGAPAVTNLSAAPANTPKSAGPPAGGGAAPAPRTVRLSVETLPGVLGAGASLVWSISGAALGCRVAADPADEKQAVLTIGTTAGTVTVQVQDSTTTNSDRVSVRIT